MIPMQPQVAEGTTPVSRYKKLQKIGEGTYGVVFKAQDKVTGRLLALKKIRLEYDEGFPASALREVSALKTLNHPSIVNLIDVLNYNNKLYLVFEFIDNDLRTYIRSLKTGLSPPNIKKYMHQLLDALSHCHSNGILHRDIKPDNVLVDKHGRMKLADFGLSREFTVPLRVYSHRVVTLWYRSPELLLGLHHYSTPIDVWSIGCIFAELINSEALWPGDSEIDQLFRIFRILGTPNEAVWPEFKDLPDYQPNFPIWEPKRLETVLRTEDPLAIDLLSKMLVYNPAHRVSAKIALKHPYFDDLELV